MGSAASSKFVDHASASKESGEVNVEIDPMTDKEIIGLRAGVGLQFVVLSDDLQKKNNDFRKNTEDKKVVNTPRQMLHSCTAVPNSYCIIFQIII